MVHETSVNRSFVRLFAVLFALVAIAVTIGIFFSKHEEADCPNITANRSLQLSGAEMSRFFQVPPSKASIFVAAINSTDQKTGKEGTLLWEEENPTGNNMHLGEGRAHIVVEERGFYLVFAQATFKVPNQNRESLMLRVDVQHPESVDQFSAVFTTHCGSQSCGGGESDVVLNKPILLWLEPSNNLTVVTRPWQLVDYGTRPISTFLTVFKYSD
ncbi:hypothetical protein SKAU_G00003450 [Synaphobranchus kaupii]|uniref:THD domain-containing protein n=1 Tax=Synaphobranchus kaupii TaxID=118154 RepID=A0A9Q1G8S8_SYNKA|nr:hypothetical protein SKAU_G00003450 [Synaphobranchus kaupii]